MYKIKNYRKNTGRGKLKGWFTLVTGDFEINGCTHIEGNKGDFVGLPQRSYEKDGETKYVSVVWMPDDDRRFAFQNWALKELEKIAGVEQTVEPQDDDIPF